MKWTLPLLAAVALWSCNKTQPSALQDEAAVLGLAHGDSLVMPEIPSARSGRLAIHAVGRRSTEAEWDARAEWCSSIPMLYVLADDSMSGTVLTLHPSANEWPGRYPVAHYDSLAEPPFVRVGLLLAPGRRGFTFQGVGGSVEIAANLRKVSGTLQVDMREVGTDLMLKYAARFEGVRVLSLGEAECRVRGLAPLTDRQGAIAADSG